MLYLLPPLLTLTKHFCILFASVAPLHASSVHPSRQIEHPLNLKTTFHPSWKLRRLFHLAVSRFSLCASNINLSRYFLLAVTATIAGILCACSLWRRHSQSSLFCCRSSGRDDRASEPDSGSCYAPPQYSRCSSFHQAPPPYSEVTGGLVYVKVTQQNSSSKPLKENINKNKSKKQFWVFLGFDLKRFSENFTTRQQK